MKSLFLQPDSWDLALDAAGNIAVCTEPYRLAQDAATAIRTFIGECRHDVTLGVPYFEEILGQAPPLELMRARFVKAAESAEGVVSAVVYLTSVDRTLSGQVQVTDSAGNVTAANF